MTFRYKSLEDAERILGETAEARRGMTPAQYEIKRDYVRGLMRECNIRPRSIPELHACDLVQELDHLGAEIVLLRTVLRRVLNDHAAPKEDA